MSSAAALDRSKKITTEKLGGSPLPQGDSAVSPVAPGFSDFESATRVTPSTDLTRAIMRATPCWSGAQPVRVIAGAWIEPRSGSPPVPVAPGRPMSPLRLRSFTSPGIARERSRSACSQSKRAAARPRTVAIRAEAIRRQKEFLARRDGVRP